MLLAGVDWDDSQTDLAHLGGTAPGAAKSGGDKLWEDNWDDDDIEDDFSVQLRCVRVLPSSWNAQLIVRGRVVGMSSRRKQGTAVAQSRCNTDRVPRDDDFCLWTSV